MTAFKVQQSLRWEVSHDIVIVLGVPGCRCHAQILCPSVQREVSSVARSPPYPRVVDSRGEGSSL